MELFPKDLVLELTTKNLGNWPSFLTITHIDIAAEFYFRIEQW
jgi:hypothetical protein